MTRRPAKGAPAGQRINSEAEGTPSPAQAALDQTLTPLAGLPIDGGCDQCDAYQIAEQIDVGCWVIRVYHDDWCRDLARMTS